MVTKQTKFVNKEYLYNRIYIDYVLEQVAIWKSQYDRDLTIKPPIEIMSLEQFKKQYKI